MESFGSHLKELREEKGKSLEDISLSTKIAMTNLDFLEKDRYDLLPPLVFVKGFVRSYARELGQDVEDTVKKLEDFIGEKQPHSLVEEKSLVPVESSQHGLSFVQNVWFNRVLTAVGALSLLILVLTGVSRVFLEGDHKANDKISKTGNSVSAQPGRSEKSRPSLTTVKPTQACNSASGLASSCSGKSPNCKNIFSVVSGITGHIMTAMCLSDSAKWYKRLLTCSSLPALAKLHGCLSEMI